MKKTILMPLIALVYIWTTPSQAKSISYWVASSPSNKNSTIHPDQIRDIFLGKKILWDDGSRIIVCHLKNQNDGLASFLNDRLGMSSRQYDFYWKSKVFSGQGYPPTTFNTREELLHFLKSSPRAIGILDFDPKEELHVIFSAAEQLGGKNVSGTVTHKSSADGFFNL